LLEGRGVACCCLVAIDKNVAQVSCWVLLLPKSPPRKTVTWYWSLGVLLIQTFSFAQVSYLTSNPTKQPFLSSYLSDIATQATRKSIYADQTELDEKSRGIS
jgi:hypothetical protein